MKFLKGITGVLALALAVVAAPTSSAQTLQVLTAGSSAQFGPFAVAAYALATAPAAGSTTATPAFHYTVKSGNTCPSSTCFAALNDTRSITVNGTTTTIAAEPGNLWVVWSANGIWAYLSVDSTVGVRTFSAVPRATLQLAALSSLPVSATTNLTAWDDGTNDTALTTAVFNAINGHALTAANTDIRPEDALFATNRALNSLGYGIAAAHNLIGNAIQSHFSTAIAHPVSFAIAGGADPFTGTVGPAEITIPIGAAPIVFVASTASGSTVANATNITTANAATLFSGLPTNGATACEASLVTGATGPISPVLREPLSGTMNTVQYTVFVPGGGDQETGVTTNPLDQPCGSASRFRAIGTGDEVNNVIATPNTLGYAFFSYESVGGGHTDRYLTLNGVDPINATYTNGALPTCATSNNAFNCPVQNGSSFPNLRNGTYPAWSIYRLITDSTGQSAAQTLVTEAQNLVNNNIPDFVPFTPVCATASTPGETRKNDPGLAVYREHFTPSTIESTPDTITITPNDGSLGATVTCKVVRASLPALTLGGGTEAGGDVGGTIEGPFTTSPSTPGPTENQPH